MDRGARQIKFSCRSGYGIRTVNAEAADEGIELNLGLSTNGRFGLDPATKSLKRSSSASSEMLSRIVTYNNGAKYVSRRGSTRLVRACSFPTEAEEARQKELQARRSTEARRQRMERMRMGRGEGSSGAQGNINGGIDGIENWINFAGGSSSTSTRSAASGSPAEGADLQGQPMDGTNQYTTDHRPSCVQIFQQGHAFQPGPMQTHAIQAIGNGVNEEDEAVKKALLDMPYVTTRGFGPLRPKIEGFLYRYRAGDDVKIVCICHGMFLSPAEFVKHGGGNEFDAAQPLKQIVVIPFPVP